VLRAKYYPNGDILKADPKLGSSFTWQTILAGLNTLKRGLIWTVVTGDKINIWCDSWIPSSASKTVITLGGTTVYTRVSKLIDPITDVRDEPLLRSLLSPFDVK
jgi:hypothetical protein